MVRLHILLVLITLSSQSFALPQKKFILMTMLYNEKNRARRTEYKRCLLHNLNHQSIERIHLIYDTSGDSDKNNFLPCLEALPIAITLHNRRATFGTFFEIATQHYPDRAIIICNADIFFDETLSLLDHINLESYFLALTRWDNVCGGEKPRGTFWDIHQNQWVHRGNAASGSQDAWIFQLPLAHFQETSIELGTLWCDPCIAYQAKNAGLTVLNPCLSVKAHHLHRSTIRHNQGQNMPTHPYLFLPLCTLEQLK